MHWSLFPLETAEPESASVSACSMPLTSFVLAAYSVVSGRQSFAASLVVFLVIFKILRTLSQVQRVALEYHSHSGLRNFVAAE